MHYHHRPDWVAAELQKMVEELELRPYSIHLPKFMLSNPKEQFDEDMDSIFTLIHRLGIEVSVLHPPFHQQMSDNEWITRVESLLERSSQTNSSLTFELIPYLEDPHLFINEQIQKYADTGLGITIDLEYMYFKGLSLKILLEMFRERILNIHFRDSDGSLVDSNGRRKYMVPGEGDIDLQYVLELLQTSEYKRAITIEVSYRDPDNILRAKMNTETLFEKIRKKE